MNVDRLLATRHGRRGFLAAGGMAVVAACTSNDDSTVANTAAEPAGTATPTEPTDAPVGTTTEAAATEPSATGAPVTSANGPAPLTAADFDELATCALHREAAAGPFPDDDDGAIVARRELRGLGLRAGARESRGRLPARRRLVPSRNDLATLLPDDDGVPVGVRCHLGLGRRVRSDVNALVVGPPDHGDVALGVDVVVARPDTRGVAAVGQGDRRLDPDRRSDGSGVRNVRDVDVEGAAPAAAASEQDDDEQGEDVGA